MVHLRFWYKIDNILTDAKHEVYIYECSGTFYVKRSTHNLTVRSLITISCLVFKIYNDYYFKKVVVFTSFSLVCYICVSLDLACFQTDNN